MYQSIPTTEKAATLHHFKYLPAFASWLLHEQLDAFTDVYLNQIAAQESWMTWKLSEKPAQKKLLFSKIIRQFLKFIIENRSHEAFSALCNSFQNMPPESQMTLLHLGYEAGIKLLPQYNISQSLSLAIVQEGLSFCNSFSGMAIRQAAFRAKADQDRLLAQLQASEQRYKEAEIIAHIGHFSYHIAQQQHLWTDELYRIFGWEPGSDQNSVQHVNEKVLAEDLPNLKQTILHAIQKCQDFTVSFRILNEQGHLRHLQARAQIKCSVNGQADYIFGIVQDVSENALLLQRLRQSRQLYEQAQAIARIGNWRYDAFTGKTYWSAEASNLYGLSHTEDRVADLEAIHAMTPFRHRLLIDGHIDRCLRTGENFSFESEAVLPDGSRKVFFNKGIADRDEEGNITGVIGTIQDITERKTIESELRANQWFSKKISDATPAIIWLTNEETGAFSFVSSMVERTLGYPVKEISEMGLKGIEALFHPEDLRQLHLEREQIFREALNTGDESQILESCYRMRHKNGSWVWLQSFSVIFERNPQTNRISQILHISVDITSRILAEAQLQQKNLLLQQSNASLQEFAYIASHDLQEPLRKIAAFGSMLQSLGEHPEPEKARLFTEKMVSSAKRMQNMINDLLTVSLISGNTSFKTTSLQNILEDALLTQELKIENDEVKIEVAEPLPEACVIPSQMQQLFQNLLGNAIKFARPGTTPYIRIHWQLLPWGTVSEHGLNPEKSYLQINISDNGIGFDNAYAQRIFAMFQRLNGRSEYAGTGIGLAICRKIAAHHGGTIFASGEKDKGATFTVLLPV